MQPPEIIIMPPRLYDASVSFLWQLKGYGVSVLAGVDPNPDNFVSAGIVNTRTTLIGCLLRLEPNKETKVGP